MTYVAPTPADLKTRYPEFANVSDGRIQAVLDETTVEVGDSWIESDRKPATLALTAHLLVSEGALSGDQSVGASLPGVLTSKTVGPVSVNYADPGRSRDVASSFDSGYQRTQYGRRYLELRRRSFPLVLVV